MPFLRGSLAPLWSHPTIACLVNEAILLRLCCVKVLVAAEVLSHLCTQTGAQCRAQHNSSDSTTQQRTRPVLDGISVPYTYPPHTRTHAESWSGATSSRLLFQQDCSSRDPRRPQPCVHCLPQPCPSPRTSCKRTSPSPDPSPPGFGPARAHTQRTLSKGCPVA